MGIDEPESTTASHERIMRAVLGSLAFVLAAAGHITLLSVAGGLGTGLILIGAAAAIFLYIHVARPPAQLATLFERRIPSRTGILVACASALIVGAAGTGANFQTWGRTDFTPVGYIQGTFLAPVILFLLISGLERRSARRTAAAGVVLGVYFSIYLGAQILAGMLLYLVLAVLLCRPLIQRAVWPAAAFGYGAVLMGLPQLTYSLRQPEEFLARLNASGTFHSGWLANEIAVTGRPAVLILAERVAPAFLSLICYPALDFCGTPLPASRRGLPPTWVITCAAWTAKPRSIS